MDKRKALFRTKLRESAQKRDKRIDSPLVRYLRSFSTVAVKSKFSAFSI